MKLLLHLFLSFFVFGALNSAAALSTGSAVPDAAVKTYDGKDIKLSSFRGKIVVLEWFNPGCPFVQKHYRNGDMQTLQKRYVDEGIVWLTVNSTNPEHRDFVPPEKASEMKAGHKFASSELILDSTGELGKLFSARTTPHMFIINAEGVLVYQGAIDDDDSFRGDPKKALNYVARALDELRAQKPVSTPETRSYGCSVKY